VGYYSLPGKSPGKSKSVPGASKPSGASKPPGDVKIDASEEPAFTGSWDDYRLSADLVKAVKTHKNGKELENLSTVQRHVLAIPSTSHVYAIAPTGSGKTLACLVPILDGMLKGELSSAIVLATTNPLLRQHVDDVAKPLMSKLPGSGVSIVKADGKSERSILDAKKVVVFSTPFQILGLAKSSPRFSEWLAKVNVVVLDEVDAIVADPSFGKEVEKIIAMVKQPRVMAFTATHTDQAYDKIRSIVKGQLHHLVAGKVHRSKVDHQALIVKPFDLFVTLAHVLAAESRRPDHKVIVFFNTAMFAELAFEFLQKTTKISVSRLHSRLSDGQRRSSQAHFGSCRECFMLSSDVAARGMDFDGVDAVIQVGHVAPDLYMQRAGRTGRGLGATGKAIILLTEKECGPTLKAIKDGRGVDVPAKPVAFEGRPGPCTFKSASRAYTAYLGAYNGVLKQLKWERGTMVQEANEIIKGIGCEPASISSKLAKKINLNSSHGILIKN
jgi:ATP-dependent RNA helicase MSS116